MVTVAISSDDEARPREMAEKIGAGTLGFGCDLSLATSREWGRYISTSRGKTSIDIEEPALVRTPACS